MVKPLPWLVGAEGRGAERQKSEKAGRRDDAAQGRQALLHHASGRLTSMATSEHDSRAATQTPQEFGSGENMLMAGASRYSLRAVPAASGGSSTTAALQPAASSSSSEAKGCAEGGGERAV